MMGRVARVTAAVSTVLDAAREVARAVPDGFHAIVYQAYRETVERRQLQWNAGVPPLPFVDVLAQVLWESLEPVP